MLNGSLELRVTGMTPLDDAGNFVRLQCAVPAASAAKIPTGYDATTRIYAVASMAAWQGAQIGLGILRCVGEYVPVDRVHQSRERGGTPSRFAEFVLLVTPPSPAPAK